MPVSPDTRPRLLCGATRLRPATEADEAALLTLHRKAYGSGWSLPRWRHRYHDGPHGRDLVYGAFAADGACLAMFCGVMLPARIGGAAHTVCRGGDVAVHPGLRATTAGPRLLLRVCRGFVEAVRDAGAAMIYGFPEPGLTRTLVRHCGYEALGDVLWLARDLAAAPIVGGPGAGGPGAGAPGDGRPGDGGVAVEACAELPRDAAAVYRAYTENGVERSMAYMQWRYRDRTDRPYRFLVARAGGAVVGGAVVRCDPEHAAMVLHELSVRGEAEVATGALLAAAADLGRAEGCRQLVTSCSGHAARFGVLQAAYGFRVVLSPYQFLFRPFSRTLTRRFLQECWDLSPGDLDFA